MRLLTCEGAMEKITCTVKEALAASGLGKTKMFELITQGRLQTVKVGTRRLVQVDSLRELLSYNPVHKPNADLGGLRRTEAAIEREFLKENQRKSNRSELRRT